MGEGRIDPGPAYKTQFRFSVRRGLHTSCAQHRSRPPSRAPAGDDSPCETRPVNARTSSPQSAAFYRGFWSPAAAMAPCQSLALIVILGWSCFCPGRSFLWDDHLSGLKRKPESGESEKVGDEEHFGKDGNELLVQETVSEHMRMLYEKYNKAGFHLKDGNTVRSFRSHWGEINSTRMQVFNLTSISKSEHILSATLHYFVGGSRKRPSRCEQSAACGQAQLAIWTSPSADGSAGIAVKRTQLSAPTQGSDSRPWRWKDITAIVKQARRHCELLLGVQLPREQQDPPPYILVYANDSDISGPEHVASTLRRPHAPPDTPLHRLEVSVPDGAAARRTRRALDALLPLQNNELPGNEYPHTAPRWEDTDHYDPAENRTAKRPRKKPRKSQRHRAQLLRLDDRSARGKQWREPRECARRYLRVDFADIGWSEWIISPKSFDAYYCSGACQFPMAKSLKPSNHATIQSIVRAVGVVPGIPEPCCVPEAMSPLSILFFDQDKNVVLKVYPNMTVDSCVCR
ncbi:bone morphogenetic protein 3-like [Arapaima gigas]